MAGTLTLEITSPRDQAAAPDAAMVVLPGSAGVMTVLPGHTPLLTTLGHGIVMSENAKKEQSFFAVHGGFAEILEDKILILADIFEEGTSIDRARAEAAAERAKDRLRKREDDLDTDRAEVALARAMARIQAHEKKLI